MQLRFQSVTRGLTYFPILYELGFCAQKEKKKGKKSSKRKFMDIKS
jgi:hypothetical protein